MKTLHRSFLERNEPHAGSGELSSQRPSQRLMSPAAHWRPDIKRDERGLRNDLGGMFQIVAVGAP